MGLLLTLTPVDVGAVANRSMRFNVNVANTGSSSALLTSLQIAASTRRGRDMTVSQPNFKTANGIPQDNPTIGAGASVDYVFAVVFHAPNTPGPSPNAPGLGPTGMMTGQPALAEYGLAAQGQLSDGSTAVAILAVPVLSAVAMFPTPQGGAALFNQGANANLIAVI